MRPIIKGAGDMTYRIGFDGVASAELTHVLRAVQNGLNGSGAHLLMHVRAEEETASAASSICTKDEKLCEHGKVPVEPPNIVVVALILVVTLLVGVAIGYRLGKLSVTPAAKN
jgi:hypothetical protein